MKLRYKVLLLTIALMATGALRMPFEQRLTAELKQQRLLPVKLDVGTLDRIEQTTWVVAMGGLRTVVASFWNLKAIGYFMQQEWYELAKSYDTIVDLAPRTRHYWEAGSWHQAYNAASYYINDDTLPPLRRREAWRRSILNGREFLERGIRNNPDDWRLHSYLGMLLLDPNKFTVLGSRDEVFTDAAEAYRVAGEHEDAPRRMERFRLYALARIDGREGEALVLARKLYQDRGNRTPTLQMLMFVLTAHQNPDVDAADLAVEIHGSEEKAYENLAKYWGRSRDGYPVHGMARAIKSLERRLGVADDRSVLLKPPLPPPNPDDWFRS